MNDLTIHDHLSAVQKALNAPKSRRNNFGNYNYRNCEDILEAVKKIMPEGTIVLLSDDLVMIGERFYVKSTACFKYKAQSVEVSAFARESLEKKGMDAAMCTGASSSYARKYALNGLFAIDDSKDIDEEDHREPVKQKAAPASQTKLESSLINKDEEFILSQMLFDTKSDKDRFMAAYGIKSLSHLSKEQYDDAIKKLKVKIGQQMKSEYKPEDYARV
jgi:hypothetical protein